MATINIVFDGPPAPEAGRFVEVEDAGGRSISIGEWQERPDGLWQLVVAGVDVQAGEAESLLGEFLTVVDTPAYSHQKYESIRERVRAFLEARKQRSER